MPAAAGRSSSVMHASRRLGGATSRVLHYADSGDVSGDKQSGCRLSRRGDLAMIVAGRSRTAAQRWCTLRVEANVRGETAPRPIRRSCGRRIGRVRQRVRCEHRLRGASARSSAAANLAPALVRLGADVAHLDYRFPPIVADELPGLSIELSILTTPEIVTESASIEIGRDGLIVEQGRQSRSAAAASGAPITAGIARRFWPRRASKPGCRAMPGSAARPSSASARKCSANPW